MDDSAVCGEMTMETLTILALAVRWETATASAMLLALAVRGIAAAADDDITAAAIGKAVVLTLGGVPVKSREK